MLVCGRWQCVEAETLALQFSNSGYEAVKIFPHKGIVALPCADEWLGGGVVKVDPVKERVPDHLLIQSAAFEQQGHRLEEVEDGFRFRGPALGEVAGSFGALQLFGSGAEEVAFQTKEKVNGLIETRPMHLVREGYEGDNGACSGDRYR